MRLRGWILGVVVLGVSVRGGIGEEVSGPTIHAILAQIHCFKVLETRTIDGQPDAGYRFEEYFDRDRGFLRRQIYPQGAYITRADTDLIEYREGSTQARRLVGVTAEKLGGGPLAAHFNYLPIDEKFIERRVPEKDFVVGGKTVKCYAMKGEDEHYEWVDERGLRVQQEHSMLARGSGALIRYRSEWTLNPELPADFWRRPASVNVVEPWEAVGKAFPLAGTVFQREVDGIIVAVHSVRQDENGVFYLVVSTRLTDAAFKRPDSATVASDGSKLWRGSLARLLAWDEKAQKLTGEYRDRTVSFITSNGIWVGYVVLTPRDAAAVGDRCAVSIALSSWVDADDAQARKNPPKVVYVPFDVRASGKVNAQQFAGEAYEAMSSVDGLGGVQLETSSVPSAWTPRRIVFEPAALGKSEFEEAVGRDVVRMGGVP